MILKKNFKVFRGIRNGKIDSQGRVILSLGKKRKRLVPGQTLDPGQLFIVKIFTNESRVPGRLREPCISLTPKDWLAKDYSKSMDKEKKKGKIDWVHRPLLGGDKVELPEKFMKAVQLKPSMKIVITGNRESCEIWSQKNLDIYLNAYEKRKKRRERRKQKKVESKKAPDVGSP